MMLLADNDISRLQALEKIPMLEYWHSLNKKMADVMAENARRKKMNGVNSRKRRN